MFPSARSCLQQQAPAALPSFLLQRRVWYDTFTTSRQKASGPQVAAIKSLPTLINTVSYRERVSNSHQHCSCWAEFRAITTGWWLSSYPGFSCMAGALSQPTGAWHTASFLHLKEMETMGLADSPRLQLSSPTLPPSPWETSLQLLRAGGNHAQLLSLDLYWTYPSPLSLS